jgi:aminocarboxymuconate-semialdehyde decarboxylase
VIIDTHAHYTPQSMLAALKTQVDRFPNIELLEDDGKFQLAFGGGSPTRPLSPKLRDTDMRLEWMDGQSIDAQVVGGWLDSFGYELPGEEGEAWCRFMNEFQMTGTDTIDRLYPLATVPMQDGKRAVKVLEEAMAGGFKGVMIGTQPKGITGNLDDPDLDPFWEAASGLGATVYLHPMFGCGDPRLNNFALMNAVGRGTDTTTAVSRLLFSGHFLKYSGMKFVLSHGGGAIPYMMGRLAKNYEIHPGQYSDPVASFRKLYFDSVLFAPEALSFLCSSCGHDKVMLGSDYPFPIGDMTPLKVIDDAGFTDTQRNMIIGETAAKLFDIE